MDGSRTRWSVVRRGLGGDCVKSKTKAVAPVADPVDSVSGLAVQTRALSLAKLETSPSALMKSLKGLEEALNSPGQREAMGVVLSNSASDAVARLGRDMLDPERSGDSVFHLMRYRGIRLGHVVSEVEEAMRSVIRMATLEVAAGRGRAVVDGVFDKAEDPDAAASDRKLALDLMGIGAKPVPHTAIQINTSSDREDDFERSARMGTEVLIGSHSHGGG